MNRNKVEARQISSELFRSAVRYAANENNQPALQLLVDTLRIPVKKSKSKTKVMVISFPKNTSSDKITATLLKKIGPFC